MSFRDLWLVLEIKVRVMVKGGNVTSAGWQVILYDPIWHVRLYGSAFRVRLILQAAFGMSHFIELF